MTPLGAVVAIIGAIIAILGGIGVALLRNSRKSPEQRTAIDSGWDKLTGGLERRIASLEAADVAKQLTIDNQVQQASHYANRIADLELIVAELRAAHAKVQALNAWLSRRVEQLVAYIVHHELTPPDEEPRP